MLFLLSVVCALEQVHTQGTFDSTWRHFVLVSLGRVVLAPGE